MKSKIVWGNALWSPRFLSPISRTTPVFDRHSAIGSELRNLTSSHSCGAQHSALWARSWLSRHATPTTASGLDKAKGKTILPKGNYFGVFITEQPGDTRQFVVSPSGAFWGAWTGAMVGMISYPCKDSYPPDRAGTAGLACPAWQSRSVTHS